MQGSDMHEITGIQGSLPWVLIMVHAICYRDLGRERLIPTGRLWTGFHSRGIRGRVGLRSAERGTVWTKLGGGLQVTSVGPAGALGLSEERLLKREGRDSRFQSGECRQRFAVKISGFECGQHYLIFFFSSIKHTGKPKGLLSSFRGMI